MLSPSEKNSTKYIIKKQDIQWRSSNRMSHFHPSCSSDVIVNILVSYPCKVCRLYKNGVICVLKNIMQNKICK